MYRKIEEKLNEWNTTNIKKLFMLVGARQTGKTYILDRFARTNFEDYLYINLEKNESITAIFERTLDPTEIIKSIEIILNRKISEKTFIFLMRYKFQKEQLVH